MNFIIPIAKILLDVNKLYKLYKNTSLFIEYRESIIHHHAKCELSIECIEREIQKICTWCKIAPI